MMWLIALALVLVIGVLLYLDTRKPKGFPPGPKWIPVLGCAAEIFKLREKAYYLYKVVDQLIETYDPDGHVLGLKIGRDKIVMVNSFEASREMMNSEDMDGRPKGIFYETRTMGIRRGILLTDGDLWKEHKRFLLRHLKDFGFGREGMSKNAMFEASHMVNDVMEMMGDSGKAVVEMHTFYSTYILNTLWTMMAGIRYQYNEPQMKTLINHLFDLFAAVDMVGTAFSHFPILCVIAPTMSGYKSYVETHERIWNFLRAEIARHEETFDSEKEDRDLMDVYIRILRENGEVNTFSKEQLVAMCMDLFMAGTETTNKSLGFALSYMVRERVIQLKAQEEIDRVIGRDRMPCLEDRDKMPYCTALVHESVRHFMGRTFNVPHRAQRDTVLAGYKIPKDTMIVTNFAKILLNDKLYPDPYAFKPERFLVNGKITLPEHYIPFGLFKHRCIGDVLAKCNIFIFTTTLLQRFTLLPAPGEPFPPFEHVDGATPSPAPFKAMIVPRT